jgi:quercetin dioxygenase-like cupin family protein
VVANLADLSFSPTAALFEGGKVAGVGITVFVVHQKPGGFVELHTHPYPETFFVIAGRGRWTAGDTVVELGPEQVVSVPPETLHGFRNLGDGELHVLSVHESPTLIQTFTDREPA